MKALVINLAREATRMAFMEGQLTALGIPFERQEAITPDSLSPHCEDPYWSRWERPLRRTEMAAFASHRAAWEVVAAGSEPYLILEDDAVLMPKTSVFLDAIFEVSDAELVTLETRGRRKLIAHAPHSVAPMHRLWQDRTGAAAYVLRPSGAKTILEKVAYAPGLADAVLCAAYEVYAWQAVPALACQLDRCEAEGITPPIETESAIGREPRPMASKSLAQILRRVGSQIRMGLRRWARSKDGSWVDVPLKRD